MQWNRNFKTNYQNHVPGWNFSYTVSFARYRFFRSTSEKYPNFIFQLMKLVQWEQQCESVGWAVIWKGTTYSSIHIAQCIFFKFHFDCPLLNILNFNIRLRCELPGFQIGFFKRELTFFNCFIFSCQIAICYHKNT